MCGLDPRCVDHGHHRNQNGICAGSRPLYHRNEHVPVCDPCAPSSLSIPLWSAYQCLSLSHTHTHTHTHKLSRTLSLSRTHAHMHTHAHTISHSISLAHTYTRTHTHAHTHTPYHTLSLRQMNRYSLCHTTPVSLLSFPHGDATIRPVFCNCCNCCTPLL